MLCGCYETLWELPEKTQPVSSDLYLTQPYYLDKRRSLTYKLHISANMCIFSKDFAWELSINYILSAFLGDLSTTITEIDQIFWTHDSFKHSCV